MQVVDWDLAVTTATRLVRPGPQVSREEAQAVDRAARRCPGGRRGTCASSPDRRPTTAPAGDRRRPARLDQGQRRRASARCSSRCSSSMRRAAQRPGRRGRLGASGQGHRRRGRAPAGLPRLAGCSASTRCSRHPTRRASAPTGRLTLVAPNIVHVERELDVDPHDFRLWVCLHEETHRTQFAAVPWLRDHIRSQMPSSCRDRDGPGDPARAAARAPPTPSPTWCAAARPASSSRPDPGPAGDPRPADRGDDAARGARRLRDGRGRPGRRAVGRRDPRASSSAAARAARRLDRICAGCSASTSRCGSTPRARASSARSSTGRHGRLQPGLDLAQDPAHQRGDPRPDAPGSTGSSAPRRCPPDPPPAPPGAVAGGVTARANAGRGPDDPAVADVRRRRARGAAPTSRGGVGAGGVQRRRRLAGAGRGARLRGAPRRLRAGLSPSTTGCRRARPSGPRTVAELAVRRARAGPGRGRSPSTVGPRGARRPRRARPATRRSTRPPTGSAPPRCCSATPATTRPRPCCWGWPAARAAVAVRDAGRVGASTAGPLLDLAAGHHPPGLPALGLAPWDDPHNDDRPTPAPGSGTRPCPSWRRPLGPGVAEALARTARLARDDADALDAWAGPAVPMRRSVRDGEAGWPSERCEARDCPRASARGCCGGRPWRPGRRRSARRPGTSRRSTGWSPAGAARSRRPARRVGRGCAGVWHSDPRHARAHRR